VLTVYVRHVHRASGVDAGRMGDFDDTEVFVDGSPGVQIIPALAPGASDVVVTKNRYSAFVNTELESILRGNEIDTVIVSGLMTQYCSVTTARHAHGLDYRVIFVSDANAGPDLPDLGFGEVSHEDAKRVILTMLAGGIAASGRRPTS
jgi:nicotinamidase-related amidase